MKAVTEVNEGNACIHAVELIEPRPAYGVDPWKRCGAPTVKPGAPFCSAHGCRRCGYVILADTEDDPEPLCHDCYRCWRCKLPMDHQRVCSGSGFTLTCARARK